MWWLMLTVSVCVATAIFAFILREGIKDELLYPLGDCDVSMFEEIQNEECLK